MTTTAVTYHASTSYERDRMTPHLMDWAHPPSQSKIYAGLESLFLPRPTSLTERTTRDVLLTRAFDVEGRPAPNLDDLTRILILSSTTTALLRHGGEEHALRSVPSAGALYPTELYVACRGVRDLQDGLYHYGPLEGRLVRLRTGDRTPECERILPSTGDRDTLLCFFLTALFFRSAWKYRSRSYRYHGLDTGHLLEGLHLALACTGTPGIVHLDFDDDRANRLLGVDPEKEVAMAVLSVSGDAKEGQGRAEASADPPPLPASVLKASRVSAREVDYPDIRAVHEAGKRVGDASPGSPAPAMIERLGPVPKTWTPLTPPGPWPLNPPYRECLFARRSRRNFERTVMSPDAMAALVEALCASAGPGTTAPVDPSAVLGVGLMIGRVEGIPSGMLLLDLQNGQVGRVGGEDLTARMARICLDQAWLAGAALHVVFMADLELLDQEWGARGVPIRHAVGGQAGPAGLSDSHGHGAGVLRDRRLLRPGSGGCAGAHGALPHALSRSRRTGPWRAPLTRRIPPSASEDQGNGQAGLYRPHKSLKF